MLSIIKLWRKLEKVVLYMHTTDGALLPNSSAERLSTWRCIFAAHDHLSQRAVQWNAAQRVKTFPHFAHKLNNSGPCLAHRSALRHTRIQWPRHCPFSTHYAGAPEGLGTVLDHVQVLERQSHVWAACRSRKCWCLTCIVFNETSRKKRRKKCRPSGCSETNTCFVWKNKKGATA